MTKSGSEPFKAVLTPHGVLRTRKETGDDGGFLSVLHESVKAAEFAALSERMRRQLLDMQFRAMTSGYRARFPTGRFEVITLNDAPIGRLITHLDPGRIHIVSVALLTEWRNLGIGTTLMTAVLDEPRRRGLRCEASVAIDNLASARLWSRLGFRERERNCTDLVLEWRPG